MTEEKTAVEEEKKKQAEIDMQEMTADDLAAGTLCCIWIFYLCQRGYVL